MKKTTLRFSSSLTSVAVLASLAVASVAQASGLDRFLKVAPGVYRGGQPGARSGHDHLLDPNYAELVKSDYDFLKALGIKTVINLRNPLPGGDLNLIAAEKRETEARGIRFLNLVIPTIADVPRGVSPIPSDSQVVQVLNAIADPANQPVYVHCLFGKDRTGLALGLYRVYLQDWKPMDAYIEMRRIGFTPLELGLEAFFWSRGSRYVDLAPKLD